MVLEIDYSFGYVFDKSKLIVMVPVGSNEIDFNDYEMEVEVAFLQDDIEKAFQKEDIDFANESIKPLYTYLTKHSKVIPFVTSIKDLETKKEQVKLLKEFDEEYELKEYYTNKNYEFKDLITVCQNISNFIPKENLETLNILKINKNDFDLENFIKTSSKNLNKEANVKLEKSDLTSRLFVEGKNNNCDYVRFSKFENNKIICANNKTYEVSIDKGDLEINKNKDFGYIIEENEGFLSFKIANFYKTQNNKNISQVVDYSGVFKADMIEFLNEFKK